VWRWQPPRTAADSAKPNGLLDAPSATDPWWRGQELRKSLVATSIGAAAGLALGLLAHGYLRLLEYIPAAAEILRQSREETAKVPHFHAAYAVMAIAFAPIAEGYLFRGLLYRSLDREWRGWRAIIGSAAFFAIYHSPLSWLPVGLLGVANAILFKKTGRLEAAVILHMVYNAIVLS
jgi:membrane protease YdiL (CAAX protease family)